MLKPIMAASAAFFLSFVASSGHALTTSFKIDNGATYRSAIVHIPDRILEHKVQAPVVFAFHGPGSTSTDMAQNNEMIMEADRRGMIVVVPNGTERSDYGGMFWNVEPFPIKSEEPVELSDAFFVEALLDHLESEGVMDQGRVYASGFSMGGILAYELACEMSDRFSAVAVVSGALMAENCKPTMPVSLFAMHGTSDTRIPYMGGETSAAPGVSWPSVADTILKWKSDMTCSRAVSERVSASTQCATSMCSYGHVVQHCAVNGGGHSWSGRKMSKAYDRMHKSSASPLRATRLVFDFFESVPGREVYAAP